MSVDLGALVNRIPQGKLNELVNGFAEGATAQQVLDFLGAAGVEATEEEAQALVESLLLNDKTRRLSIDELAEAAGGKVGNGSWVSLGTPEGDRKWVWISCEDCAL